MLQTFTEVVQDPHNNTGRHCDVIGVSAPSRSWRVLGFVRDQMGASYHLVNVETGAQMRAGLDNMTNLY